jgi:hypothetical protein
MHRITRNMPTRHRIGALALASTLALGGVALASAGPAAAKAKAHHNAVAGGKQYLALIAAPNAAIATFVAKAGKWGNSTTNTQAEAAAKPVINALRTFNRSMVNDRWPAGARTDIKGVVTADAPVIGDLQSLATVNLLSASSWTATFERDASGLGAAVAFVRHDLGLPAAH